MHGAMTKTRSTPECLVALVWCILLFLAHWLFGSVACGWQELTCVPSRHKDTIYQGVLADPQGRMMTGAFTVSFPLSGKHRVGGFSTDAEGRYCVVWAPEASPTANIGGLAVPLQVIDAPGRPIPPGCQEGNAGIPWKHADDLKSSPQYLSLLFTLLIAGGILMGGLAYAGDTRPARLHREAGLAMTVVSTLLFAVLWL